MHATDTRAESFTAGGATCVAEPTSSSARRLAVLRTDAAGAESGPSRATVRMPRHFSANLVASMEEALRSGVLTLPELRFALQSATLRSEDDIRQVCAETLRLKQAIINLGKDAQSLMKRVHPHTVAMLLRSWSIDQD